MLWLLGLYRREGLQLDSVEGGELREGHQKVIVLAAKAQNSSVHCSDRPKNVTQRCFLPVVCNVLSRPFHPQTQNIPAVHFLR